MTEPGPAPPRTFPVADLERRFYAFVLDRALIWGAYAVAAVVGWSVWGRDGLWTTAAIVVGLALLATLLTGVVVGTTGSTPGKSAAGLRVVHQGSGTPIGAGAGILRSFILALSALPTFGFGLATLAWTAVEDRGGQRRGWHDLRARSVVVDVRPAPPEAAAEPEAPRHVVNLTALRLVPAPAAPAVPLPQVERPLRPAPPAQAGPVVQPPAAPPAPVTAPIPVPPMPQPSAAPPPAAQPPAAQAPVWIPPQTDPADSGRTVVRGGRSGAPAPSRWRVVFDTGDAFVVEGLVLVGRRPEPRSGEVVRHVVPLPSADMSLSKTHAQFGPAPDGTLVVMDRGSTNGSLLLRQGMARELVAGKPTTLLAGDRVRFGDREMSVLQEG